MFIGCKKDEISEVKPSEKTTETTNSPSPTNTKEETIVNKETKEKTETEKTETVDVTKTTETEETIEKTETLEETPTNETTEAEETPISEITPIKTEPEKTETIYEGKAISLNKVNHNLKSESEKSEHVEEINETLIRLYNILAPKDEDKNFVISPTSIYLALELLDYIGDNNVKEEIRELLGLDSESLLYSKEIFKHMLEDDNTKLFFTNSIWFDNNIEGNLNQNAFDGLANDLYCDAFKTTFKDDNEQANIDITEFVKEMTNGLINKDFGAKEDTLFALFNTLYLKDGWSENSTASLNIEEREFDVRGEKVLKDFLMGYYHHGLVYSDEYASSFYQPLAKTSIRFIVPNENVSLSDAMNSIHVRMETKEYLKNYREDSKTYHKTRCIFPKFTVSSSINLLAKFAELGYLKQTMLSFDSNLIDNLALAVSAMNHDAVLKVYEEGIEGAAVTSIIVYGATSVSPIKYIYHDFVIDKKFGFMITDQYGLILFMGTIVDPLF